MDIDAFSLGKRFVHVGDIRVAYRDEGAGPPLLLLHGCPFSEPAGSHLAPLGVPWRIMWTIDSGSSAPSRFGSCNSTPCAEQNRSGSRLTACPGVDPVPGRLGERRPMHQAHDVARKPHEWRRRRGPSRWG